MKKTVVLLFVLSLIISVPALSQGSLLKKVGKAMKDELLGTSGGSNANQDPEPGCACADAQQVVDLGGKLKLNYKELGITSMDDGSLLLQDKVSGNYYIVRDGVTQGPIRQGDPRIAGFENSDTEDSGIDVLMKRYKGYISKSGEKYVISFAGKTYGPYAQINSFAMPRSKDKFAAIVVENVVVTKNEGDNMDRAMKNAKTDQERMELAMKYTQDMQNRIISAGGPEGISGKLVSNIPDVTFNPSTGGILNGRMKYDDILVPAYDKIVDLKGNTLLNIKPEHLGASDIFVSSDNSKYAVNQYGTLLFSNNKTTLTDLFNPLLIKESGSVYLTYMYYSPKKNSIMQCKIAF